MKSILQNEKQCFVTDVKSNLHRHHIYFGIGLREISEQNGFWVYLEGKLHNQSNKGVHCGNRNLDLYLKKLCQAQYEETHTRKEFMELIGKNYLE